MPVIHSTNRFADDGAGRYHTRSALYSRPSRKTAIHSPPRGAPPGAVEIVSGGDRATLHQTDLGRFPSRMNPEQIQTAIASPTAKPSNNSRRRVSETPMRERFVVMLLTGTVPNLQSSDGVPGRSIGCGRARPRALGRAPRAGPAPGAASRRAPSAPRRPPRRSPASSSPRHRTTRRLPANAPRRRCVTASPRGRPRNRRRRPCAAD